MSRRTRQLLAAAAGTTLLALAGAPAAATPPQKTRVYVVVLDGLRPDEVRLMPFLSSLATTGTYYREARAVMVAETIPNHVAMVTGTYPDRNGIVANDYPDVKSGTVRGNEDPRLLQADSLFSLVQRQCPALRTAAVTSKDYLYEVMQHDRTGDGRRDADTNFANVEDPTFIPGLGLTPDERTLAEATRVSRELDPDFLFVNLGSIDRFGHADETGGATTILPTGSRPAARDVQRTNTDNQLRAFVERLKAEGRWDRTALMVTADHSMDWSLPTSTVSLTPAFQADPLLRDQLVVAQNGGAALYSLRHRDAPRAAERLTRMRAIALRTPGVDEALYRQPNPLDGRRAHWVGRVHPDWHQTSARSGDLIVTAEDGRRMSEPGAFSNPIPGNHGMPSTLRIPLVVSGGLGVVQRTVTGSSDPDVRSPAQAENVDVGPTAAWLLGVSPPRGGFDGRPLTEAFRSRPGDRCAAAPAAATSTEPATAAAQPAGADVRAPAGPGPTGPGVLGATVAAVAAGLVLARQRRRHGTDRVGGGPAASTG